MKGNDDLQADPQFNGNISWIEWSVPFQDMHQYGFTYDNHDRLTQAIYRGIGKQECEENNPGFYDVYITGYDNMGNIGGIERFGLVNWSQGNPLYGVIDDLDFGYNGNKLMSVSDDAFPTRGFQGAQNETFTYDNTGNLTSQSNVNLSNVQYNFLDLPEVLTFPGGTITNYYTGDGRKLKSVYDSSGVTKDRLYEDGFEYYDDELESLYHEEGRAVFDLKAGAM